ncbi:MAG: histidine kinase [Gammaproteobacteria bacterium]|nr:histidine kinase [Gammaproteobacteria bacterium]
MRRVRKHAAILALILIAWASPLAVRAADSYAVFYGDRQGFHADEITALAQDGTGFIWIGSQDGLLRFDGEHFLHYAQQQIPRGVWGLWWNEHTGLVIQAEGQRAFVKRNSAVRALIGADGKPVTALADAAFDGKNQLWTIIGGAVWRRDLSLRWSRIPARNYAGERPLHLSALAHGIALITDRGAWHFDAEGHARALLHVPDLIAAAGGGDHPLWLASIVDGNLWREENGDFRVIRRIKGRVIDLRYRGDTLWVSVDRYLLAIAPDGGSFILDVKHGLPSGGPLLVDREGSLWVGSFVGLQQFPAPETRHWTERDGLPWQHAYGVTAAGGKVWVDIWRGGARFDTRQSPPRLIATPHPLGRSCADREGRVWQTVAGKLGYWHGDEYVTVKVPVRPQRGLGGCAPALDGGEWLATNFGVYHADFGSNRVQRVVAFDEPAANLRSNLVWQENAGRLWTISGNRLCRYVLTDLRAKPVACSEQPFENGAFRVVRISPGHFWIATKAGLFLFDGESLRLLADEADPSGERFQIIEPAPSGGYWAISSGGIKRIAPCRECTAGYRVLESIDRWQGVPADGAKDVVELPSGDLWIVGNRGVYQVPAQARIGPRSAPPIVLVRAAVDGHDLPLSPDLRMQPGQKHLSLTFAALTYRDRSRLRYRFREQAGEAWSAPTVTPTLRWIKPPPGTYRIEAEASLDGLHWSAPARYGFTVAPPWYQSWWARLVLALLIVGIAVAMARLWLAHRLSLERQRLRIAMDLHDELGSTLGSISMLAGAISRDSSGERERLAARIADASTRLGSALRTVVWTMRQPQTGMRQLLVEIGDQTKLLFPGEEMVVRISGELHQDIPLSPEVCRHVLMVALEALHNAAHHAHACEINVQLQQLAVGKWRLTIRDDGDGFDSDAVCSGSGFAGMRRRAHLIGGHLVVCSDPGAGTSVQLDFSPQAKSGTWRLRMIMRWRSRGRVDKMRS